MDAEERFRLAAERADRYAPPPRWEPLSTGFLAAAAAGAVIMTFAGLARLHNVDLPAILTIGAVFLAVWYPLKRQKDRNSQARVREFHAINQTEGTT